MCIVYGEFHSHFCHATEDRAIMFMHALDLRTTTKKNENCSEIFFIDIFIWI